MKAKAMVTMARNGPAMRTAGIASRAPTSAVSAVASGSASQKLSPACIRIACP